ncbi:MAG: hypothetical protein FJ088_12360, partial [Deltaproteobacteria bacterium]|nr:hypothetical protein [Deltaproteobacteria bacterium]
CSGKQCGPDGCNGSCGTCQQGYACDNTGKCVCQPDCANKECGPNGCNGTCGTCPAGKECDANGKCQTVVVNECGDITETGKCEGNVLKYCENDKLKTFDCALSGDFICAYSQANKKYQCVKKTTCTPDCSNRDCGPDGCGSLCGECQNNEFCSTEGKCVPLDEDVIINEVANDTACTPDCDGKQCGSNGCGGSCGGCPSGYACDNDGQCILTSSEFEGDAISQDIAIDAGGTGGSGGCSQTGKGEMLPLLVLVLAFLGFVSEKRRKAHL